MKFEKFTGSKEEQRFAERFNNQRASIRQRGHRRGTQQGAGDPASSDEASLRQREPGILAINLDEEQRPYADNHFALFEPVPVTSDGGQPQQAREYMVGAGDASATSRPPRGNPRVQSAILNQAEAEQPSSMGAGGAANKQQDAQSELLRDYEDLDSNTDSQKLSGIAVIDGRNARRPDRPPSKPAARGFKQFTHVLGPADRTPALPGSAASSEQPALQDDVVFSNLLIDNSKGKTPATENKYRILNQSAVRHGGKLQAVASGGLSTPERKPATEPEMTEFKSSMPVTGSLIGILNLAKTAKLDDRPTMQQYIKQKGVPLLEDVGQQLDGLDRVFDKQTKSEISNVEGTSAGPPLSAQHIKGEKFTEHHDDDFQEWEQYDIIHVVEPRENCTIAAQHVPAYIREDITRGAAFQNITYKFVTEIKCGVKLGRKVSDGDARWAEKWFEIRCKDAVLSDSRVVDVIVKSFSKFWTKGEFIEGECCHQVLADGSKSYVHDGLLFELKDFYKLDNIVARSHKQPVAPTQEPETAMPMAGLDFGRPKQVTIPAEMASDNVHKFKDQDVFKILDKDAGDSVVYEAPEQPKQLERIPSDILGKFQQKQAPAKAPNADPVSKVDPAVLPSPVEPPQPIVVDASLPFAERPFKMHLLRAFLTQFDGSQHSQKLREEGAEHEWTGERGTTQKSATWWTQFVGKCESQKETSHRETDASVIVDPNLVRGEREGRNQYGQFWKEDWQVNETTGYKRWNKMTLEYPHLRDDGFESKWGEWREEQAGLPLQGERWMELFKEDADYWERKSEKYTEYQVRKPLEDLETALDTVLEQPNLIRSGLSEFRNNRNYLYAEKWDEFQDGTQHKKIILDDGYGKRTLTELGKKLSAELLEEVKLFTDERGYFMCFQDSKGVEYRSLQELIEKHPGHLAWDTTNETEDDISNAKLVFQKAGQDTESGAEWNHKRVVDQIDKSEEVVNTGKDGQGGHWSERWTKKGLSRWAEKEGVRDGQHWKESWHKKVKELSKKLDANGVPVADEYESDGSEIEESHCEKWGKNEHTQEEWHEKWGEVHKVGKKEKWCDKWQVDLRTGLKKGENWGQHYDEDYRIKEHWAEKWDDRHQENGGVYEKRHERD